MACKAGNTEQGVSVITPEHRMQNSERGLDSDSPKHSIVVQMWIQDTTVIEREHESGMQSHDLTLCDDCML